MLCYVLMWLGTNQFFPYTETEWYIVPMHVKPKFTYLLKRNGWQPQVQPMMKKSSTLQIDNLLHCSIYFGVPLREKKWNISQLYQNEIVQGKPYSILVYIL